MQKNLPTLWKALTILLALFYSCQFQQDTSSQGKADHAKAQIEADTKKLLAAFLEEENMNNVDQLLDPALKFHWPDKTVLDKEGLMNACRELTQKHDNKTEIIDIAVDGNRSFILFVWSGEVMEDDNPNLKGRQFSIHDCWRLTWENGKIVEWYTIWGSMDYLMQLGYIISPPSMQ